MKFQCTRIAIFSLTPIQMVGFFASIYWITQYMAAEFNGKIMLTTTAKHLHKL